MKTAGVREVKNHLSAYLRDVKGGGIVRITERGEVVAELRPPQALNGAEAAYEQLVAEGKVRAPSRAFHASLVQGPRGPTRFAAGFANELIDADREGSR